jgi:hypothetical protein
MRGGVMGGARTSAVCAPLALAGVVMAVIIGACGSTRRESDPPASRVAVAPTHASLRPFGAELWRFYRLSGREPGVANVIDRAEQLVEADCMHRAGFSYWPVQTEPIDGIVLDDLSRVPGPRPPGEARALRLAAIYGFGIGQGVAPLPAGAAKNSRYVASLSAATRRRYEAAFIGDQRHSIRVRFPDGSSDQGPSGGCLGEAARTVYGSTGRDDFRLNAVVDVMRLVDQRVAATAAVRSATKRWARCLKTQSGHTFSSEDSLIAWVARRIHGEVVNRFARRLEDRYATMSTTCRYTSDLASRGASTTWAVMTHMPALWYRTLVEVQNWDARALPKARAILVRSAAGTE